jgi:hypothetical protein
MDKNDLIRGPSSREAQETSDHPFPTEGAEGTGTPREQWEEARLEAGGRLAGAPSEPSGNDEGEPAAEKLGETSRGPAGGQPTSGA